VQHLIAKPGWRNSQGIHKAYLFAVFTLLSTAAVAQLTLSGEIRPRVEYRDGFKRPIEHGSDAAFFVEQRTRINAQFTAEKFDVYVSFQDVRNWGATAQVYKSDPSLQNLYEAWAAYKINQNHTIRIGRVALDYDNARIIGNLDWAAQGRSHDVLKYELKGEHSKLHVGAAFNQDAITPEPNKLSSTFYGVPGNYKTMQFAWFHRDWKSAGLSALFINNGVQSATDSIVRFSQTAGVYGTKSFGNVALEYDAYYQFGKNPSGKSISAYLLGANLTFWKSSPMNLTVGADLLSGDKSSTLSNDETFNPLYGTHHKFYGVMDYFYVGNGHKNKGLVDVFVKTRIKTGERSNVLAHLHQFFSQSAIVTETSDEISSSLGTELDLVYNFNITQGVVLNAGYSAMFFTNSLEYLKDSVDPRAASWAWIMIGFKPTLFTTKSDK
jgi:hypothetical protein